MTLHANLATFIRQKMQHDVSGFYGHIIKLGVGRFSGRRGGAPSAEMQECTLLPTTATLLPGHIKPWRRSERSRVVAEAGAAVAMFGGFVRGCDSHLRTGT